MYTHYKIRSRGVIISEGELLVVCHMRDGASSDFFAFPGGHLDAGELPDECIRRELIEELGIAPTVGRLLYVYTFTDKEGIQSVEFFFEIENGDDFRYTTDAGRTHAHEIAEMKWIKPEDIVSVLPQKIYQRFTGGTLVTESPLFIKE